MTTKDKIIRNQDLVDLASGIDSFELNIEDALGEDDLIEIENGQLRITQGETRVVFNVGKGLSLAVFRRYCQRIMNGMSIPEEMQRAPLKTIQYGINYKV